MAARILRQANKIALLGAPSSAAALGLGHERAPEALRGAGIVEQLRAAGYDVADLGDDPPQLFQPDEESPRARNLSRVLAALEALKPRVEIAVKSGAVPLILGGDCTIALATVAGVRRYYRNVGIIYMDSDADLNVPATSPSGCLDGMVVAHLTGRGAAELVRFWGEPPLVREPEIALFGVNRFDPPEEELLRGSAIRCFTAEDVRRRGAAVAAREAVEQIHGTAHEFILHLDVDAIAREDFSATNLPSSAGLRLGEVREALSTFLKQEHLLGVEVTSYNPERDPGGTGARLLVDMLSAALAERLAGAATSVPAAGSSPESLPIVTAEPHPTPTSPTEDSSSSASAGPPSEGLKNEIPGL